MDFRIFGFSILPAVYVIVGRPPSSFLSDVASKVPGAWMWGSQRCQIDPRGFQIITRIVSLCPRQKTKKRLSHEGAGAITPPLPSGFDCETPRDS
jgi:hypothetical protein